MGFVVVVVFWIENYDWGPPVLPQASKLVMLVVKIHTTFCGAVIDGVLQQPQPGLWVRAGSGRERKGANLARRFGRLDISQRPPPQAWAVVTVGSAYHAKNATSVLYSLLSDWPPSFSEAVSGPCPAVFTGTLLKSQYITLSISKHPNHWWSSGYCLTHLQITHRFWIQTWRFPSTFTVLEILLHIYKCDYTHMDWDTVT